MIWAAVVEKDKAFFLYKKNKISCGPTTISGIFRCFYFLFLFDLALVFET